MKFKMKKKINELLNTGMNKGLTWTTIASEKLLLAIIGISALLLLLLLYECSLTRIELADLFIIIYAEILAMVGAFYSTNRIPVTLPIIGNYSTLSLDYHANKRYGWNDGYVEAGLFLYWPWQHM